MTWKDRFLKAGGVAIDGIISGVLPAFVVYLATQEHWIVCGLFLPTAVGHIAEHVMLRDEMRQR